MITAENVWKSYPVNRDKPGFKEFIVNAPEFIGKKSGLFWALKGLNFSVKKGECLGVIGKNGAGKSTLLSLLLGTSLPGKGTLTVNGKRTPLLELGAGFHQDMTGRENLVMNGILLGLTRKEALARQDAIIDFSGLSEFIDRPLRTYSGGMYMRLAFSVAVHTDPEILLIDEILSVGDEFFQKKSGDAITGLIKRGTTTVLVSHNMESIRNICSRVIWLEHGVIMADGIPGEVIGKYLNEGGKDV
ncbi:MAG: Teichoic acids export ATP-binding protein TagH [Candidatus Aerophobetes bacterium ADurb.Bin490]|nr:MAG: Teichoic acids export ATP-binding protein TagH [Candidatus Aerophobetes bacterium ADurb.Bin490]HPI04403.1 ABC transporter ATP-binding protein [Candidatus Goldiibacteriota bacterium]HPN65062.1 ABC transporter ATP-binding protein [Candidatus Goldiibacteriota bacterium]HRQ43718.1 ABC transporter ATP-binding protein [Candidatus Goldiibacteriota bacterium]